MEKYRMMNGDPLLFYCLGAVINLLAFGLSIYLIPLGYGRFVSIFWKTTMEVYVAIIIFFIVVWAYENIKLGGFKIRIGGKKHGK